MSKDKIVGIYCIESLVDNKKYIGQSVDIIARFYCHKSELRRNCHENTYVQNAWNNYGEDNFKFSILLTCEKHELNEQEKYYIKTFNSLVNDNGFNIATGGKSNIVSSEYTKNKISKNHANVSGINNPFYGKKHSAETMDKILKSDGYINRKVKGEDSHLCTITNEIALFIKQYFSDGHKTYYGENTKLAEKLNVSTAIISHIKNGHSWKDI